MMGRSSDFEFWEENLPIHNYTSPSRWTRAPVDFRQETSTLIPQNHHYSCLSPTSRRRAIEDGRRELMEMVKNIPESSYELSLKDIVDDQRNLEQVEQKKVKHKAQSRIPKKSQICRTASMESAVFLLKMFVPVSLISKRKPKARKKSEICPGQSSEKQTKDWWKMISLAVKDNQSSAKIDSKRSNISTNRISEKKCKSREQRGCLF